MFGKFLLSLTCNQERCFGERSSDDQKKRQKQKKYQQEEEKGFRNDEETVIYAEEMCDCCMHFWVLQVLFFLFVLTTLTLKESI